MLSMCCAVLDSKVKYSRAEWTALLEHLDTKKHKNALNALSNQPFLGIGASSSSTSSSQEQEPSTSLQQIPPAIDKARAAEAKWLFKVAENDFSLLGLETDQLKKLQKQTLASRFCSMRIF